MTLEALHNRVLARVDTGDQYLTTASLDAAEAYLMGHLPPATPDDKLEEEPEPFRSDDDGAVANPELEVSPSPVLGPTDRSSWLEDCSVETLALALRILAFISLAAVCALSAFGDHVPHSPSPPCNSVCLMALTFLYAAKP